MAVVIALLVPFLFPRKQARAMKSNHSIFHLSRSHRQLSLALISALAVGLGSCTSTPSGGPNAAQSDKKLEVMTTFLPITNFTKAVAGDRAQVTQLLPNNVGPHDYQAKPEDVQKLTTADVLVENGLEMEAFLDDMVKNAGNNKLTVIDSSQGITTIPNETEHEHGEEEHQGKEHTEGEEHAEGGHDHGENNPHIWLDPKRVIQQVENIRDGLIAADPEGKSTYDANATAYIAELKKLDAEFTEQLKPYAGKTFVTYHDFADYFAGSYGLKVEYLVGIPEENAKPEDVQRVLKAAKASNLNTLLSEPQATGSPFTALAKDLNVKVGTFDPLETGSPEALEADYYLITMRENLKNLTTAFGGQTQSWVPAPAKPRTIATLPQFVQVKF